MTYLLAALTFIPTQCQILPALEGMYHFDTYIKQLIMTGMPWRLFRHTFGCALLQMLAQHLKKR